MNKYKSISDLVMEYFKKNPNKDLKHGPVVDWVEAKYVKLYKKKPRDTWRAVRKLHQEGFLIKVKKGIYRYDTNKVNKREVEEFTPEQKKKIFDRDGYRCVQCGRRQDEGYELHVDHRVPKDYGGQATVDNGQTLCSVCNFRKKNYGQTETGKKMIIRMWEAAKKIGDKHTQKFCEYVLAGYEMFNINDHIEWKKGED